MIKQLISILLVVVSFSVFAQKDRGECISGDCENGYGVYKTVYGHVYKGMFKNGEFNDTNAFFDMGDGYWYKGGFVNSERSGYGINQFGPLSAALVRKEGFWKNGRLNGHGKTTWKGNFIEEGEYIDSVPDGKFIIKYQDDNGKNYMKYVWYSKEKPYISLKEQQVY